MPLLFEVAQTLADIGHTSLRLDMYIRQDIVRYRLEISDDAIDDLRQVYRRSNASGAAIETILEELEGDDQVLLDLLTSHGFRRAEQPSFDVKKWKVLWDAGYELWRLKPFLRADTPTPYRIIYAYLPHKRLYVVLGIVERSFEYDPSHPLSQRILAAYAELASDHEPKPDHSDRR